MASRLQDVILRGLAAARPLATAVAQGTLYYSTDTNVLQRSNGTIWESYSAASGITQLTGDVTAGPGSGSIASTLTNTAVTPGAYTTANITVDAKGRVTAAASGSGGGLVLVEQYTAAGVASLNFTGISSTYDDYLFEVINMIPVTNAVELRMRVSTNGGVSYDAGNNYSYTHFIHGSAGFSAAGGGNGVTYIYGIGTIFSAAVHGGVTGRINLRNPLNGVVYPTFMGEFGLRASNDSNWYRTQIWGAYISITPVNAIQFLMSSGNIASGTIRMYGHAK